MTAPDDAVAAPAPAPAADSIAPGNKLLPPPEALERALAGDGGPVEVNGVRCIRKTLARCSPLGITNAAVERVRGEPPAVKKAAHLVWREVMAGLGARPGDYEPLWVAAGLEPVESLTQEDLRRGRQLVEEALKECEVCVVDLATFLSLVEHVAIAERARGEPVLVVELDYRGRPAVVVTKPSDWVKRTKDGLRYVMPLTLQERLRMLGLAVDAAAEHLYIELTRRAEHYALIVDAFVRPILWRALQQVKTDPSAARCTRDRRVIYIATDVIKEQRWAFDAHVGLGRNSFYRALRRLGLLASAQSTVPARFVDEYGNPVEKRALALSAERLGEFLEVNIGQLCDELEMLRAPEEGTRETQASGS
jgi:hypothetical protein